MLRQYSFGSAYKWYSLSADQEGFWEKDYPFNNLAAFLRDRVEKEINQAPKLASTPSSREDAGGSKATSNGNSRNEDKCIKISNMNHPDAYFILTNRCSYDAFIGYCVISPPGGDFYTIDCSYTGPNTRNPNSPYTFFYQTLRSGEQYESGIYGHARGRSVELIIAWCPVGEQNTGSCSADPKEYWRSIGSPQS